MSFAGNNSGYQEVFCPVLEITVDIRTCILCWKLVWISGCLMFCARYNSGYQGVLCPVLEITDRKSVV
jgi:hypothetical protein